METSFTSVENCKVTYEELLCGDLFVFDFDFETAYLKTDTDMSVMLKTGKVYAGYVFKEDALLRVQQAKPFEYRLVNSETFR